MSLINRMLRDLSTRAPSGGDVTAGVRVRTPRAPEPARRLGLLVVLVAGFSAALWLLVVPKPGSAPDAADTSRSGMAPAAGDARASGAALPRFQFDMSLSTIPSEPPARRGSRAPRPTADSAPLPPAPVVMAAPAAAPLPRAASARDQRKAEDLRSEAAAAAGGGDASGAERLYRSALALDGANDGVREGLGRLLLAQGRLDEAATVLAPAGPSSSPGLRRLAARLDLAMGQPASAIARLESGAPTVRADPEYHGILAAAYQRVARHEDAIRTYEKLIQAQPAEAHWWAGLGLSKDALGDAAAALNAYAQARERGRLEPSVLEHIDRRTAALQAAP